MPGPTSPASSSATSIPTLPDVAYHRAIAERGAVLGYDLCGYDIVQSDGRFPAYDWETADAVAQLVAEGFADRIILSQDTALKTDYLRYGGWGYGHVFVRVVPLLRERGVSEEAIEAITVGTPARITHARVPVARARDCGEESSRRRR